MAFTVGDHVSWRAWDKDQGFLHGVIEVDVISAERGWWWVCVDPFRPRCRVHESRMDIYEGQPHQEPQNPQKKLFGVVENIDIDPDMATMEVAVKTSWVTGVCRIGDKVLVAPAEAATGGIEVWAESVKFFTEIDGPGYALVELRGWCSLKKGKEISPGQKFRLVPVEEK